MSVVGLGCAKTPAVAPHVEISPSNCIPESQIILLTRGSMPCWRIVFSTFCGCMSFYTARTQSGHPSTCNAWRSGFQLAHANRYLFAVRPRAPRRQAAFPAQVLDLRPQGGELTDGRGVGRSAPRGDVG